MCASIHLGFKMEDLEKQLLQPWALASTVGLHRMKPTRCVPSDDANLHGTMGKTFFPQGSNQSIANIMAPVVINRVLHHNKSRDAHSNGPLTFFSTVSDWGLHIGFHTLTTLRPLRSEGENVNQPRRGKKNGSVASEELLGSDASSSGLHARRRRHRQSAKRARSRRWRRGRCLPLRVNEAGRGGRNLRGHGCSEPQPV